MRTRMLIAGILLSLIAGSAWGWGYCPGPNGTPIPCPTSIDLKPPDGSSSTSKDLQDLEHGKFYVWDFNGTLAPGSKITKAEITFTNLWNSSPSQYDALNVHLLNSPNPTGSDPSVQDYNLGSANYTATQSGVQMHEWIKSDTDATNSNHLINDIFQQHYIGTGSSKREYWNDPNPLFTWYNVTDVTAPPVPADYALRLIPVTQATRTTLTYTFTSAQLATLNAYILDGLFALGFDPDCHYYNEGVKLYLETQCASVPEPGAMMLLGSGLVGLVGVSRKRFRK